MTEAVSIHKGGIVLKNVVSFTSAILVALNLLIGFSVLLPVAVIGWFVPVPLVSRSCAWLVDRIYRVAVNVNSFWMQKVVGIELVIHGNLTMGESPVVICNHQSWFDIPLVQDIITRRGPIVKFLVKREIVWIPIIGWICLALNFPRLYRNKESLARENDFSIIQKASKQHGDEAGALLIFPEGTRFTEQKRNAQKVAFERLVRPKSGGLKMIQKHVSPDTPLVDVTINYHQKDVSIWRCLHGDPLKITITLKHYTFAELDDVQDWLNQRWHEKDQLLLT